MPVQSVSRFDPTQFFRFPSTGDTGIQRLDTQVGGVSVSNDLSGRLSVTTAEGDKITLIADLEAESRSVNYQSHVEAKGASIDVKAKALEYSLKKEFGVTVEGDLSEEELNDLAKLFRKVFNIFRKFFRGQDEEALTKTAKLAERFGNFSSLAGLDLSVDVERSVTVIAAQSAAESASQVNAPAALPSTSTSDAPSNDTNTPGAAPSAVAAIPLPSSGTTAPTPPSADPAATGAPSGLRLAAPVSDDKTPASLVEQVLDALKESNLEPRKLRRYLPRLIDQVREEFQKELHGQTDGEHTLPSDGTARTNRAIFLAYQSFKQASLTLSVRT